MSITIESEGFTNARKVHDALIRGLLPANFEALMETALLMIDHAVELLFLHDNIVSGNLISSVRILSADPQRLEIVIGTDVPYSVYIEYGRGPIPKVPGRVLHWIDKKTGLDVFAMSAGPVDPMPFMAPAVIYHRKQFKNIMIEKSTEIVRHAV